MSITKNQFLVLTEIERSNTKLTQRKLSNLTELSLGLVNNVIQQLTDLNYIKDNQITENGLNALEPYLHQPHLLSR